MPTTELLIKLEGIMANSQIIAQLNDVFRNTGCGGKILLTAGIANLNTSEQFEIFQMIQSFNEFTKETDPYDEHDFGVIKIFE